MQVFGIVPSASDLFAARLARAQLRATTTPITPITPIATITSIETITPIAPSSVSALA